MTFFGKPADQAQGRAPKGQNDVDDKVENQWHRIKRQELNRLFINQFPFCFGTFRFVSVCVCNKNRDTEKEEIKSE
jgi:hypothetical protein